MRSPKRGPLPQPGSVMDQLRSRKQSCSVQVLRSVGQWSSGTRLESSIHSAYLSAIHNAKAHVLIMNQFFISGQVGAGRVGFPGWLAALLVRVCVCQ
jgi:phospholipase D1/2